MMKPFFSILFVCIVAVSHLTSQTTTATLNFSAPQTISTYLYGFNQDHEPFNSTEKWTIRRLGGNRMTAFNWENNASNSGEPNFTNDNRIASLLNIPNANKDKAGEAYKVFHQSNTASNVQSIVTVPIQGYVAADKSGAVTVSPPSNRWNSVVYKKNAAFSLTPNTADGVIYLDESINFLVQTFGNANSNTGVKYIALDNEPAYWDNTHNLIQPTQPSVVAYVQKVIDAAKAVKAIDPNIKIIAGEFAGANIFDFANAPDWDTEKGSHTWFISYFLQKMKQASDLAGYNLIDIISVHFYPQHKIGTDGNFSNTGVDVRDATLTDNYIRSARMSFSRSLWDNTYIEPSWLSNNKLKFGGATTQPHKLLIRLKEAIDTYYPGVKMMIGEYDYGHDDDISHGIGIADFLGVCATNNVNIATRWDLTPVGNNNNTTTSSNYTGSAYRLFRNYNGANGTYGDKAINTTFNNIDKSSVWASIDSDDNDLHIILLNKEISSSCTFSINLNQPSYNYTIQDIYGFDATNTTISSRTHNGNINNGILSITLPNLSAYHIVLTRSEIVVPIALRSFDAQLLQQKVVFNWQIADEKNVNRYEIERGRNGKDFELLKVQMKGKNTAEDYTPQYGQNYYRLKIIENNGHITYSAIKVVFFDSIKNYDVIVYPNPTSSIVNLDFFANQAENIYIQLFNSIGQRVYYMATTANKGYNVLKIPLDNFPKGIYILNFKEGENIKTFKIVMR